MSKNIIRTLCAALALAMVLCAAALAETETKTYKTYEPLDAQQHTVYEETWIYPIVNGVPGSGKPGGDNVYEEPHSFVNGVCVQCGYTAVTFTNAMGVVLAQGTPAADALRQVMEAMAKDANPAFVGDVANAGNDLLALLNSAAEADMFTAPLSQFPAETVDGAPCNVVTLAYNDDEGNPITENYAFSTADTTLVKLY